MISDEPAVINLVVKNDLCIGCGVCVNACPTSALKITWNEFGFLTPRQDGYCCQEGMCLKVCPFNPIPEQTVRTENEISEIYIDQSNHYEQRIGNYIGLYAGFAHNFRKTSSSGGVATYILSRLLEKKIVNHVVSVKSSGIDGVHYQYGISSSCEDLLKAAKTRYYPVTLADILPEIHKLDGKVAVVGVACFIKAIRLAQYYNPDLKEKIPFLVGIICGGVKSKFFTEYLGNKVGVSTDKVRFPEFRIKDINAPAIDYSFGCLDGESQIQKTIKMRTVGDMWGTGYFKANACDYCDDVASELADISLGDAWIPPYMLDGSGSNVVVTRSLLADSLIEEGIRSNGLEIETLAAERFVDSQQGAFNHRQKGLPFRIKRARKNKLAIPPKRNEVGDVSVPFLLTLYGRGIVRKKSLEIWREVRDSNRFDKEIQPYRFFLKILTKLYHLKGVIARK
ncbi:4Fe-4S binding protein [Methylococcaceae bacterium WWC4]|nr:4Fe-4S binding protein [Methylococcaceae bacterium WWC4]